MMEEPSASRPSGNPALTVLLTVYNGMPYLPLTVESILGQTFENFLFLIINNGSTDATADYLRGLDDPRLLIHHLPQNIGRTPALNYGLKRINTEYTAVVDADDLAAPERLARQVALLQARPELGFAGSSVLYIDAGGGRLGADDFPAEHDALMDHMTVYNPFAHAACCFRTRAANKVGGYPSRYEYAQDLGLWMALLREGWKAASIPARLACIRRHPAQATRNPEREAMRLQEQVALAREFAALPGLGANAAQAAQVRLFLLLRLLEKSGGTDAEQGKEEAREESREPTGSARSAFSRALEYGLGRLLVNPLLWKRVAVDLDRLWRRGLQQWAGKA